MATCSKVSAAKKGAFRHGEFRMLFQFKFQKPYALFLWVLPYLALLVLGGCSLSGKSSTKSLIGGVNVTNEKRNFAPVEGPSKIYVQDFKLDVSDLKTDSGVGGLTDQVSGSGGILGRLNQRMSRGSISGTAEDQVPQITLAMSESLISGFSKRGVPAERLPLAASEIPRDGWLVRGHFVEVDEGNRAQRAALGFGLGATQMEAQVEVADLSSKNPNQPFLIFGTNKEAGMKPGGFNPYVMAAKFHMEKKATVQDIQKTADEIVAEVLKSRDQAKSSN